MTGKIQSAVSATTEKKTLRNYIEQMGGEIKKALPSVMTPERFTRIALSAISSNAQLAQTTPQSFLGAMMTAAQLGLEPNTPLGQAYLIPFKNGKKGGVLECQFQLGYKGMIDLAYRSGEISSIQAHVVYENDKFEYAFGLEPKLEHIPAANDRGKMTHVYAVFRTKDGGFGFEVMSADDVARHAQRFSKSYNSGPWQTNFEEMAKKTVLKKALKYAPMKTDFVRGIAQDETVKTEISADMYSVAPEDVIETDGVDTETGEVLGTADGDGNDAV